jgi:hypothetical protein
MHGIPWFGGWNVGRATATGGTAFAKVIPPYFGPGFLAPGVFSKNVIHVGLVTYTTGATIHQLALMRPFNWCVFSADAAASQAVVTLDKDPGLYSTAANWRYGPFPGGTPRIADNAIAASDYVVYQAADGTFVADTVASGTYASLTLTTALPTGGVKKGGILWFFGAIGDSNPLTADINYQWKTTANTTNEDFQDQWGGIFSTITPGDPAIFYSPNTSNQGSLEICSGFYSRA